ncbi:MAG: elongation factor G [Gammaproteobacteria bacterium]|nr:elongation factor G [Gammaproteobacteria bacterium]
MKLSKLRNIGIIAHVDAGKTTVTERILYYTGKTHKAGDVHHGTTTTDFSPEERKRGITIYSAATTVFWQEHQLNVIDTPGHIDFNIEVNRSLRVLDGAVVVFDAVAGVEPQSETNWRLADKYGVPRICFVNKMDRVGANFERTVKMIQDRLGAVAVPLQIPFGAEDGFQGVIDLISMRLVLWNPDNSQMEPCWLADVPAELMPEMAQKRQQVIEVVADADDQLMAVYLEGGDINEVDLIRAIRMATLQGKMVPVLCGSAYRNKGVELLLDAVVRYLPAPDDRDQLVGMNPESGGQVERALSADAPFAALAFKVVHDKHGSLTFVRVYSGSKRTGDMVFNSVTGQRERIGRMYEIHADKREPRDIVYAGDIVAFAGLKHTTTGNTLCDVTAPIVLESIETPVPVIDIAIEAGHSVDQHALMKGLHSLVSEDPSLSLRQDAESGQLILSGMGELQLEVTLAKLDADFGVSVRVGKPKVAYRETITQAQELHYRYKKQDGGPGQFAEIVLRIEPLANGEGFRFENQVAGGAIPREFIPGVEAGVKRAASMGVVAGYPVVDFKATLLDGTYHAQDSSVLAFEKAAFLAFQQAAAKAGAVLMEPMMTVTVQTPADYIGDCIGDLVRRQGLIQNQSQVGSGVEIQASVPLAQMFGYIGDLRAMTSGRASFTMQFERYSAALRQSEKRS